MDGEADRISLEKRGVTFVKSAVNYGVEASGKGEGNCSMSSEVSTASGRNVVSIRVMYGLAL
jgi:hypothetical protein